MKHSIWKHRFCKKAQSAIEFMMVVGFAMILIVPGIYLFYSQTNDSSFEISATRAEQIGNALVQQIEYVYPNARNTKTTLDFTMPNHVVGLSISQPPSRLTGTELIMEMNVNGFNQTLVFFSRYPVFIGSSSNPCEYSGAVSSLLYVPGQKALEIRSCGRNVSIYEP